MSTEEKDAPKVYDLTESGKDKVEADGELRAANPDPNFNPEVNEKDAAIQDNVDEQTGGDPLQVVVTGTPLAYDPEPTKVETEDVETEFYVAQKLDPRRLVPGSNPYLDDVERERAEIQRAKIEDREPDLDNPPAVQGTPMYTTAVAEQSGLTTAYVEPDLVVGVPVVANDNVVTGEKSPLSERDGVNV